MSVRFLGVRFDPWSMESLATEILTERPSGSYALVTPNVNIVCRAARDAGYAQLLESAEISVNDSRILRVVARVFGKSLGLLPGSDLTATLLLDQRIHGLKTCIIGGDAEMVDKFARGAGLNVDHIVPPMGLTGKPAEYAELRDRLVDHDADVFFVALGPPLQDRLVADVLTARQKHGVFMCVGGSIDFLTGTKRRAPKWVQVAHLEWAFRMVQEPRRLAWRYIRDFATLGHLALREARSGRQSRSSIPVRRE